MDLAVMGHVLHGHPAGEIYSPWLALLRLFLQNRVHRWRGTWRGSNEAPPSIQGVLGRELGLPGLLNLMNMMKRPEE